MTERSHGAMRPSLPQSYELPAAIEPVRSRTEGRDAAGRFVSGNPWAPGNRWRQLIAEGLGRHTQHDSDVARDLSRRAYRYFRSFLRDLPIDSATTRSLTAQRARAAALADFYGLEAARLQLTSAEALKAAEAAAKWCQRAERLAVTTLDIASRLATAARAHGDDDLAASRRVFQQQLAERQAAARPALADATERKDPSP